MQVLGIRVFVQSPMEGIWGVVVLIPQNVEYTLPGAHKYSHEGVMTIDGITYNRYVNTTYYNSRKAAYEVAKGIKA